jgi:hypothetical protein
MQMSNQDLLKSKFDRLVKIDTPQGPVWLEKGLNFDLVKHLDEIPYSKLLADLICEKIAEGLGLIKACKDLNLPYSIVRRWKREHEEFKESLIEAQRDGAEALHDEVLDVARTEAAPKDKIAALQWSAERANAERFGKTSKVSHNVQGAVTILVSTGIVRPGDPGFIPAPEAPREVGPVPTAGSSVEEEEIAYTGESDE